MKEQEANSNFPTQLNFVPLTKYNWNKFVEVFVLKGQESAINPLPHIHAKLQTV